MASFCAVLPCQTPVPYSKRPTIDLGLNSCGLKRPLLSHAQQPHRFTGTFCGQRLQRRTLSCRADKGTPGVTELTESLPPVSLRSCILLGDWKNFIPHLTQLIAYTGARQHSQQVAKIHRAPIPFRDHPGPST